MVPALAASFPWPDVAAAQLQKQLLGGGTGKRVGGEGVVSSFGIVATQLDDQLFRLPARQDGVYASGCPSQLVFQHGVGARTGLAHPVLDVREGAHGER